MEANQTKLDLSNNLKNKNTVLSSLALVMNHKSKTNKMQRRWLFALIPHLFQDLGRIPNSHRI